MVSLKSLQKLIIGKCPDLAKRCKKGIGEDWFKIAHVAVSKFGNQKLLGPVHFSVSSSWATSRTLALSASTMPLAT